MQQYGITHVEWATTDLARLKDFLAALFGWKFEAFGEDYFVCYPAGLEGVSVGLMQNERAQAGGTPNVYISVPSIDACLAQAGSLGGSTAVPKTGMGNAGSFAFVKTPDGNLVGLHEAAA